jgi:hypothetical protein
MKPRQRVILLVKNYVLIFDDELVLTQTSVCRGKWTQAVTVMPRAGVSWLGLLQTLK